MSDDKKPPATGSVDQPSDKPAKKLAQVTKKEVAESSKKIAESTKKIAEVSKKEISESAAQIKDSSKKVVEVAKEAAEPAAELAETAAAGFHARIDQDEQRKSVVVEPVKKVAQVSGEELGKSGKKIAESGKKIAEVSAKEVAETAAQVAESTKKIAEAAEELTDPGLEVAAGFHARIEKDEPPKRDPHATKPEDRIPFLLKVIYGLGAFVNNALAAAIGGMSIVLNLGLGMNPALVGLLGALPRLSDAITDPLMGYISDHTKSRWGRRRPYIFVGAIAAGVVYVLLWSMPRGQSESFYFWWFLIGSILFYLAYTIFATPWVALGYELTPDYHERTRLMGVQNFMGQLAYVVSPWFLWIMTNENWFKDQLQGAFWLAGGIALAVMAMGLLPAIFLKERFNEAPAREPDPSASTPAEEKKGGGIGGAIMGFVSGMWGTISSVPFLLLCGATFLVFNGFILISSFQFYVIIYYVFGGDQLAGAEYAGYAGTVGAVSTFIIIFIVTWMATKIGKKNAFYISIGISILGYGMKWFCYDPDIPWLILLPAPFMAFGLGALFTLMGSMIADVVDVDEVKTYERREGMFGSIYWWVVKLGMAAALAGGGFLLNATGFDVALGGDQAESTITMMRVFDAFIPAATSGVAILLVWLYPITEDKAHETREVLEARRGAPEASAA